MDQREPNVHVWLLRDKSTESRVPGPAPHFPLIPVLRRTQQRKTRQNDLKKPLERPETHVLNAKNAQLAFCREILVEAHLLNAKFLGFKKLISNNFQVKYVENRNYLIQYFALFRNHLLEHFALFWMYKGEHFRTFSAKYTL